jgi:asparagine synthase (glutamine-hydrolysing)
MCGIVGMFDPRQSGAIEPGLLERMTERLAHRGPDAAGFFREGPVAFGFRRLAIIDLVSGNQPMISEDGAVVSMCNGELYNHRELRRELAARGHHLKTSSDCEVIPHLYEEYGMGLLDKLNGQFAFAIYDRAKRTLFLARDQFGIQPLYYTRAGDRFLFASEIKALLEHPGVGWDVNLTGLDQALCFPGVVSPTTMIKSVSGVKNGEYITINANGVTTTEYWDLDYPTIADTPPPREESYYVERLEELLLKSVERRLQADVPVGVYLSGGLDSSLVAGAVRSVSPDVSRHTFSISFLGGPACEGTHQRAVAAAINAHHHDVPFDVVEVSQRLKRTVYHSECPLKESYNAACMALSETARANGISVILTGQGSDELFAGYPGYRADRFFESQRQQAGDELTAEEKLRLQLWGDRTVVFEGNYTGLHQLKLQLYAPELVANLASFDCFRSLPINRKRLRRRHFVHKRSYLDFKLRLADHLLVDHGDRMAMANGVEVRHPFLDIDVVNFVKEIPADLKLNGFEEKYIVKRIAESFVPPEILKREKFGWFAAASTDLLRSGDAWVHDMLSYDRIKRQGYFNADTVETLKKQYQTEGFRLNQPLEADTLMFVLTFGLLLDTFHRDGAR